MPIKTLRDCAKCSNLIVCDAHITDGSWKHREGVDPCTFEIDECKCPKDCMSDCAGCRYNWEENDKDLGFV